MILFAILAVLLLGVAVLLWVAERAPMGYEDETGFHRADEAEQEALARSNCAPLASIDVKRRDG